MPIHSADKELIKYFIQLNEPQKKSLLQLIKSFLNPSNESTEKNTIELYNTELDDAIKRINKDEFTTLEELEKEIQSW